MKQVVHPSGLPVGDGQGEGGEFVGDVAGGFQRIVARDLDIVEFRRLMAVRIGRGQRIDMHHFGRMGGHFLTEIAAASPQINAMIGYIGRRKKRDKLVLGTVIGLCSGFLLWYSMS